MLVAIVGAGTMLGNALVGLHALGTQRVRGRRITV